MLMQLHHDVRPESTSPEDVASFRAMRLVCAAFVAIGRARLEGRITDELATMREQYLAEHVLASDTPEGQIAVCQVILMVCRNNLINSRPCEGDSGTGSP